jgi:hypothetical protein
LNEIDFSNSNLMRNAKEKIKKDPLGDEILPCPLSHLSQKRES